MPPEEVKARLNRELTAEMQVYDAYEASSKVLDIGWAKYEMELYFAGADAAVATDIERLFTTSPVNLIKKTKSGEKEIDIVPMIRKIKAVYDPAAPDRIRISTVLRAGATEHLNPEFLIKAAKEHLGILSGDPATESYSILRTHVYCEDGVTEFR